MQSTSQLAADLDARSSGGRPDRSVARRASCAAGSCDTDISRPVALALVAGVPAAASIAIPLSQAVLEKRRGRGVAAARRSSGARRPARTCASSSRISRRRRTPRTSCSRGCRLLLTRFGRVGNKQGGGRSRRLALLHAGGHFTSAGPAFSIADAIRSASEPRSTRDEPPIARRSAARDPRVSRRRSARAGHPARAVSGARQGDAAAGASCTARGDRATPTRCPRNPDWRALRRRAARGAAWRCSIRRRALPPGERAALPACRTRTGRRRGWSRWRGELGALRHEVGAAACRRRASADARAAETVAARRRRGRHAEAARRADAVSRRRR